ncbi:hypothetical protein CW362_34185 [Streptomyces populi]|uniref:Uncharacterized protein n=1 Tax=Streptomyces populi TaxID=2058924 RepID=A0A2I0SF83_9ACTN|nr:hypothetical protein CW362_34185 [Streptomyces populi]
MSVEHVPVDEQRVDEPTVGWVDTTAGDRGLKFRGYEPFRAGHDGLRDRDDVRPRRHGVLPFLPAPARNARRAFGRCGTRASSSRPLTARPVRASLRTPGAPGAPAAGRPKAVPPIRPTGVTASPQGRSGKAGTVWPEKLVTDRGCRPGRRWTS